MATMEVPSDFLHTSMNSKDPKVHMVLQGKLAELMVKVGPKIHRKLFRTDSKGRMIFYFEMKKALYVMLKPVLLFYMNLDGDMTIAVLKINPYDPCIMNNILGGEHMTVLFHVDHLKVSH